MIVNKDYENLREEVMYSRKAQDTYAMFLYTTVVTILSFAFQLNNYYLCLLPIVVTIPIAIKIADYRRTIAYIATYMIAFLEKDTYQWETNNFYFSQKKPRKGLERIIHVLENYDAFILSSICTLTFSIPAIYDVIIYQANVILNISLCMASLVACVIVLFVTRTYSDYQKLKTSKLKDWNRYKSKRRK